MPDLLTLVDVNVLSSLWEAAPISTLEAMASEVPTVCTRVGALPEMMEEGRTGFMVDVGDDGALAARIVDLLTDEALRARIGRASRACVEERFSIRKIAADRGALYRTLLEGRR